MKIHPQMNFFSPPSHQATKGKNSLCLGVLVVNPNVGDKKSGRQLRRDFQRSAAGDGAKLFCQIKSTTNTHP
jgi:hypothetical protein